MVAAGDDWNDKIQHKLDTSEIILCLVSRAFLASDYIQNKELPKALLNHDSGKAILIPLVLTYCSWERTDLHRLQTATSDRLPFSCWEDESAAYLRVEQQLENVCRRLRGLPECPFSDIRQ